MAGPSFDAESLRHVHESDTEWKLRKGFLLAHHDKFDMRRLLCLASCFVNVECYGCSYPGDVMTSLRELKAEIQEADVAEAQVTSFTPVKFVKSSDPQDSGGGNMKLSQYSKDNYFGSFVKSGSTQDTHNVTVESPPKTEPKPTIGMIDFPSFVKSSKEYRSTDVSESVGPTTSAKRGPASLKGKKFKAALDQFSVDIAQEKRSELDEMFYRLAENLSEILELPAGKNPISALHMAADKCRMTVTSNFTNEARGRFVCNLQINFIQVSKGQGSKKKDAKQCAYETAVQNLQKPYLNVVQLNPEAQELQCSDSLPSYTVTTPTNSDPSFTKLGQETQCNINTLAKSRKRSHSSTESRPLEQFLILEPQNKSEGVNSTVILMQSADFNKMKIYYDFREETQMGITNVKCRVLLDNFLPITSVEGQSRVGLKSIASDKALEQLKQKFWTIQIKKHEDSDGSGLSRDEILGDIKKKSEEIPDSNVGNKLLRMMGWSGGGVGKAGQGIAEPVSLQSVINREGLGLQAEKGIGKQFLPRIKQFIQDYASSNQQTDLVFSPDFAKEERALIHKESQKLGLKTRSYGKGGERYLVVCRNRNASELFKYIMSSGGETSKYILIPPGVHDGADNM